MALILVAALLWGVTNPLLKRHSVVRVSDRRAAPRCGGCGLLVELYAALTRLAFVGPFILNQCGSVAFTYSLMDTPLSVAVPVANAMTFAVTSVTSTCIGEENGLPRSRASVIAALLARRLAPHSQSYGARSPPPLRTAAGQLCGLGCMLIGAWLCLNVD
jgi:hypothetical protein